MSVRYGVAARADAVATTTADIVAVQGGTSYSLTANVAAVAAVTLDYLYTLREVGSSGPLGGTSDASVSLFRLAHRDTQADAVATVTSDIVVQSAGGTTYELVAAADAIAAASAAVSTVNAVAASADSAATVSAAISAVYALAAQADATSNATASVSSVLAIAADVAATSTADAPMSVVRALDAQVDSAATTSVEALAGPQVYTLSAAVDATSDASADLVAAATATETPYASSYRNMERALRERASKAVAVTAFRLGTFAKARARSIARAVSGLQGIRAVAPTTLATATVEATTGFAFRSASRVTVPVGVTVGGKLAVVSGAVVGASAVAVRVGGQRSRTAARAASPAYATASTRLTLQGAHGVTRAGPLHDEDEDELILAMYAMLEAA